MTQCDFTEYCFKSDTDNSICVIGVYFGEFPHWFDLWIKSAVANSRIDFLIYTDHPFQVDVKNICIIRSSMDSLKKLAEKKLKMHICLERPYKWCDLRPAYGLIFEEDIGKYEYWGHCDFDMIFGDIYTMLNKYNYKSYDKFLIYGHLSFFRNIYEVNHAYLKTGSDCGNYDKVFTEAKSFAFDEQDGITKILKKNDFCVFEDRIFADIAPSQPRFKLTKKDKNYFMQVFYWCKGKVYRKYWLGKNCFVDEYIYIHMQKRKFPAINFDVKSTDCFLCCVQGFVPIEEHLITRDKAKVYNKTNYLKEGYCKFKFRYKDYIKFVLKKIGIYSILCRENILNR